MDTRCPFAIKLWFRRKRGVTHHPNEHIIRMNNYAPMPTLYCPNSLALNRFICLFARSMDASQLTASTQVIVAVAASLPLTCPQSLVSFPEWYCAVCYENWFDVPRTTLTPGMMRRLICLSAFRSIYSIFLKSDRFVSAACRRNSLDA